MPLRGRGGSDRRPTARTATADPTHATATNEPTEATDRQEPTDPTLSTDPTDQRLNAEPTDPTLSTDPTDPTLSTEPRLRMDRTECDDSAPHLAVAVEVAMLDGRTDVGRKSRPGGYPDQMQWLARGEGQVPTGQQWLTGAEAARAGAMRFTKRRNEYLVRRYAGKCAVAAAVGLPADPASLGRIGVLNRMTGAPYVEVDGRTLGLDISLTDRAGWAVCLVGPDLGAVGVDLEIVEPRSAGFVSDFLTPAEQAVVASAPGPDGHDAAANLIWSAKESALKVLRTGLARRHPHGRGGPRGPRGHQHRRTGPSDDGWQRLTVSSGDSRFPGWWRRDGVFLLTMVAASGLDDPPQELPGSADLTRAEPIHSWVTHPLVELSHAPIRPLSRGPTISSSAVATANAPKSGRRGEGDGIAMRSWTSYSPDSSLAMPRSRASMT